MEEKVETSASESQLKSQPSKSVEGKVEISASEIATKIASKSVEEQVETSASEIATNIASKSVEKKGRDRNRDCSDSHRCDFKSLEGWI